jgi:CheY-like chemotaxis protein
MMQGFPPADASSAGLRVLVVDDNLDAAQALALLLRLRGHDVRVALDGAQALTEAAAHRPHVAFLDIDLPDIDGYELARRLRADPVQAVARLVALTGHTHDEDRRLATAAGFDELLIKPIGLEELTAALPLSGGGASP